jgi:hypothetical protein
MIKEYLTHPVSAATGTATALFGVFQLDAIAVLLSWGWSNLGQVFYMGTLLASSSSILPVSQATAAKIVGALAALLLLKLGLKAREQIDERTDG